MLEGKPKRTAVSVSEELGLVWNVLGQLSVDKDSDILYKLARSGKFQFIVRHHKREEAIQTFHDLPTAGHRGVTQTYDKIREKLWWPKLKEGYPYTSQKNISPKIICQKNISLNILFPELTFVRNHTCQNEHLPEITSARMNICLKLHLPE